MSAGATSDGMTLDVLLDRGLLRSVYQPIVDLASGETVAYEALLRGPEGDPLEHPLALFGAARAAARLHEVDLAALRAALAGVPGGEVALVLFVNLEAETIAEMTPDEVQEIAATVPPGVQVVVEVTERALLLQPGALLRGVARLRAVGWRVAVDDVGAQRAPLALMPFLRPDVIKMDLGLVQHRASLDLAQIVNVIAAQAERSDAPVLAEGIETEAQAYRAVGLGATFGQGWHYGFPGPMPIDGRHGATLPLPHWRPPRTWGASDPFTEATGARAIRQTTKPMLVAMSRHIESQALLLDDLTVVLAGFERASAFTGDTRRRFAGLARTSALVAVLGPDMPAEPAPGVRGCRLLGDDPIAAHWSIAVVAPHFAAALVAADLGDGGPERNRRFDYLLTYDREVVLAVAALLLDRVQPAARMPPLPSGGNPEAARGGEVPAPLQPENVPSVPERDLPHLLLRAVDTTANGVCIADAQAADHPLVYVNAAFLAITGYPEAEILGRNCRFLQGPGTDPGIVRPIGRLLGAGRPVPGTLLRNYRRDGTPFWNELSISPVHDTQGRLTHFIGHQNDVTERVERERLTAYRAHHDALTGLPNRAQLTGHIELELRRAQRSGGSVAVIYLDLDGLKSVNDAFGHAAGDEMLREAGRRLGAGVRDGDLVARHGGDEFVLVLGGLHQGARSVARRVAEDILRAFAEPMSTSGGPATLAASIGITLFPEDASTAPELLVLADVAMYRAKSAGGRQASFASDVRN